MRAVLIILINVLLFQISSAKSEATSKRFQVVKDLRSEILVYDSDFSSYVPYNSEIHQGAKSIVIRVEPAVIARHPFIALLSPGTSILLDNKLYKENLELQWIVLDQKAIGKSEWITLFNSKGKLPFEDIFYGVEISQKAPNKLVINKLEPKPTQALVFHNFFIIVFITILVTLAVSKIFNNKSYNEFYNIQRNTLAIGKDQSYIFKKPLNSNNLFSLLIHSFIFVFAFFIIQYLTNGMINLHLFNSQTNLGEMLRNYLIYTLVVFVAYMGKYFLIAFISYLYNVREYKLTHFFSWVKLSMLFFLILFPLVGLVYIWHYKLDLTFVSNIVFFILIFFSIAKILVITYNLNKIRAFRNLYLFSYLCVTEIIPLFIVFKLLI